MGWFAAQGRVALVPTADLLQDNGLTPQAILPLLERLGFRRISFDPLLVLRDCVGVSLYRRGAHPDEAPSVFDCSTLAKWWYGLHGISLRRYAVDQRLQGEVVEIPPARCGDLVFSAGRHPRYRTDPLDGVGHVGICTGEGTIVHAAGTREGVMEVVQDDFSDPEDFRGFRRIAPLPELITFQIPPQRCVEHTDDLIWLILQSL